jgi:predicted lipoprotein with Yx(FWY)xxD motif
MWRIARGVLSAVLLSLVASVGVASAQYNYPSTPQPAKPPSQSTTTLNVASAMIGGKSQPILVDVKRMSLYYLTSDTATSSACTGGCAGTWPPLLSDSVPAAPSSAMGKLAIVKTANGSQVSYNGHLLYRFKPDTKPGDVNGDGIKGPKDGVWHVATPDMKAAM